jgi:hypothetical protein
MVFHENSGKANYGNDNNGEGYKTQIYKFLFILEVTKAR